MYLVLKIAAIIGPVGWALISAYRFIIRNFHIAGTPPTGPGSDPAPDPAPDPEPSRSLLSSPAFWSVAVTALVVVAALAIWLPPRLSPPLPPDPPVDPPDYILSDPAIAEIRDSLGEDIDKPGLVRFHTPADMVAGETYFLRAWVLREEWQRLTAVAQDGVIRLNDEKPAPDTLTIEPVLRVELAAPGFEITPAVRPGQLAGLFTTAEGLAGTGVEDRVLLLEWTITPYTVGRQALDLSIGVTVMNGTTPIASAAGTVQHSINIRTFEDLLAEAAALPPPPGAGDGQPGFPQPVPRPFPAGSGEDRGYPGPALPPDSQPGLPCLIAECRDPAQLLGTLRRDLSGRRLDLALALTGLADSGRGYGDVPDSDRRFGNAVVPDGTCTDLGASADRFALVIGNDAYGDDGPPPVARSLTYPAIGAGQVGEALNTGGFRVRACSDLGKVQMAAEFTRLADEVEKARRGGADPLVVIYFAGHGGGLHNRGQRSTDNLVMPVNAISLNGRSFADWGIKLNTISHQMKYAGAQSFIFIFDACRSPVPGFGQLAPAAGQGRYLYEPLSTTEDFIDIAGFSALYAYATAMNLPAPDRPEFALGLRERMLAEQQPPIPQLFRDNATALSDSTADWIYPLTPEEQDYLKGGDRSRTFRD